MKKKTCLLIALLLAFAILFGACGNSADNGASKSENKSEGNKPAATEAANDAPAGNDTEAANDAPAGNDTEAANGDHSENDTPDGELPSLENASGVKYVMIYNPDMYYEDEKFNDTLNTGKFGNQIDPSLKRADGLEGEQMLYTLPQSMIDLTQAGHINLDGDRAGAMFTPYEKGDVNDFYCFDGDGRALRTFECIYAGEIANIWKVQGDDDMNEELAETFGEEFEDKIYETDVDLFGEPRFADNGHKVNLLFYDCNSNGMLGVFYLPDLFASNEVDDEFIAYYESNTDHAIVSVNTGMFDRVDFETVYSTMAHEFQHLINFSTYFDTQADGFCATWINEAMSGFVEDYIYSGVQNPGRYNDLASSDLIRYGQSLYNFAIDDSMISFDIGVYGSVYLYSTYLANIAGDGVFHKITDYWRRATDSSSDAGAIHSAVPSDVEAAVDSSITYPQSISGGLTADEEWLSKLTLNFYLDLLSYDSGDPEQFRYLEAQTLLYDQINASDIEGGGRVIVALKGDSFEVPEDADEGLIYIGLDADFNVITAPLFK